MNQKEIKKTIDRYNERLEEFGVSEKALGWGDKGRSKLRFKALCSEWDLENKTILDYGCGFGDLYEYIKDNCTKNFKYIGIDLNQNFIDIAKKRNYSNAEFYVVPPDTSTFFNEKNLKIDYILSSGIFNFKLNDNIQYIKDTLEIMNKNSTLGFSSNFLNNKVDFMADSNYHADPAEILDLHYQFSNNVILKNNYMPYEFTVMVNKGDSTNKEYNTFESFVKYI